MKPSEMILVVVTFLFIVVEGRWSSWKRAEDVPCHKNCTRAVRQTRFCILSNSTDDDEPRCVGDNKKTSTEMCAGGYCGAMAVKGARTKFVPILLITIAVLSVLALLSGVASCYFTKRTDATKKKRNSAAKLGTTVVRVDEQYSDLHQIHDSEQPIGYRK